MIQRYYFILLASWICFLGVNSHAQTVTIQSLPQASSLKSGFEGQALLLNADARQHEVYLRAEVRRAGVMTNSDQTDRFGLKPGVNSIDLTGLQLIDARQLAQGTPGQSGDFELCLEVHFAEDGRLLAKECNIMTIQPMTPPYLVYPFNRDVIEHPMPLLSWTPPAPIKPGMSLRYTLKLVEVPEGIPAEAALRQRQALIFKEDIMMPSFAYPVMAPALETDKQYAWQIEAFSQGQSLGRSEVWTFSLAKPVPAEEVEIPAYYVELKHVYEASIYPAKGQVCFKFEKRYNEELPRFEVQDDYQRIIDIRPSQLINEGNGLFRLKLEAQPGLRLGNFYSLRVFDAKGHAYLLKFQYQESFATKN